MSTQSPLFGQARYRRSDFFTALSSSAVIESPECFGFQIPAAGNPNDCRGLPVNGCDGNVAPQP